MFGDTLLWTDPVDFSGILVGGVGEPSVGLARDWPGLSRAGGGRDMTAAEVRANISLDSAGTARYAAPGSIITDDNQLLAYGAHRMRDTHTGSAVMFRHAQLVRLAQTPVGASP